MKRQDMNRVEEEEVTRQTVAVVTALTDQTVERIEEEFMCQVAEEMENGYFRHEAEKLYIKVIRLIDTTR